MYARYGAMLDDIIARLGEGSKKELHISLKRANGIESLTHLTKQELYNYMLEIDAHFASEYGWELLGDENKGLRL